jgi:hypothetical protein
LLRRRAPQQIRHGAGNIEPAAAVAVLDRFQARRQPGNQAAVHIPQNRPPADHLADRHHARARHIRPGEV